MKILAIDTSTHMFSLAVVDDTKVLAARNVKLNQTLSDSIITLIKQVLKRSRLAISEIDGFVIGLGPGSFTSLRVGLSTVKALSLATGKPVVGIASLDAIAMNTDQKDSQVCVVTDARRDLVYSCLYRVNGSSLERIGNYALTTIDEALAPVKGETVFTGDGLKLFKEKIMKSKHPGQKKSHFVSEKFWYPQGSVLARLALKRFQAKKTDDAGKLVPLYLYPADCQVRNGNPKPKIQNPK